MVPGVKGKSYFSFPFSIVDIFKPLIRIWDGKRRVNQHLRARVCSSLQYV